MAKYESYNSEESKFHPSPVSPDGETKNYDFITKIHYPYLVLEGEDIPLYRIDVLSSNLEKLEYLHDKVPEGYFDVYLKQPQGFTCLGMIHSDRLRSLLTNTLYDSLHKYIMLTDTKRVEGNMMLSLCTIPNI
jgi:hypothetical protein